MPAKKKSSRTPKRKSANADGAGLSFLEDVDWKKFSMVAAVVVALGLTVFWILRMEGVALKQRVQREIAEHPATAGWFQEQRALIDSESGPVALWCGEVKEVTRTETTAVNHEQKLVSVTLQRAMLLAGAPGERDDDRRVHITVYDVPFAGSPPENGERWLFSVWRNVDGHNKMHAALPCPNGHGG
jgi:hypothetical protein